MNLLSLCQADTELKKVATTKGVEYAGACPWCGGNDRFRVWPETGRYWCRGCGKKGDVIQYLRDKRGLSFPDACRVAGREDKLNGGRAGGRGPSTGARSAARPTEGPGPWKPKTSSLPGEQWQEQAGKLVEYAAGKLNSDTWAYLNGRGLADDTIQARRLGLLPAEKYVKRGPWGLPKQLTQHDREKDLWLPAGVVIPYFIGGKVARVRIRRQEAVEDRYWNVSGSYMGPMVLGPEGDVIIVVESELDGFLLAQDCGDMAGVVALGNAQSKPDTGSAAILAKSKLILVALDADQAGAVASWQWWLKTFTQARRWPPVGGKDPGEMWQAWVDLKAWVGAGIDEYKTINRIISNSYK
ncbi:primase-helicase zinc-binding domain-containing protein [Desulfobacca acetoxidans]|uniref:p4 alpha zinc-binding domain protein n=1 Tax=Desulfobacca acetoxidans (strain ATCC 700848 / DSM 11109 / ASRB2) TaxID=880072 RepID=F2NG06_DESAR|nr:primase-helicase zinc-binding domain-containing protein [Desulfobacca acetoxidans]AEB08419.1 P4 alpha zinc-binding domain protein [Desulfobacca acetoxidans DSM 11109]